MLYDTCEYCNGTGTVESSRLQRNGEYAEDVESTCLDCKGTGKVERESYSEWAAYYEGVD